MYGFGWEAEFLAAFKNLSSFAIKKVTIQTSDACFKTLENKIFFLVFTTLIKFKFNSCHETWLKFYGEIAKMVVKIISFSLSSFHS